MALAIGLAACGSAPDTPTPAPIITTGTPCGVERWAVKTLADVDAGRVDFANVVPTTIASLNGLAAHCSGLPDARTFAEEFRVYEVTGIVHLTRNEDDHDVHIALADVNDLSKTVVVEIIDPSCSASSVFQTTLTNVRTQFQSLGAMAGKTVRVRGVGFYDFAHGQTGRSDSCVELHPVISIQ